VTKGAATSSSDQRSMSAIRDNSSLQTGAHPGVLLALRRRVDLDRGRAKRDGIGAGLPQRPPPPLVHEPLDPVVLRGRHSGLNEGVHLGADHVAHALDHSRDLLELLQRPDVLARQLVEVQVGVPPHRVHALAHGEEPIDLPRRERVLLGALPRGLLREVVERRLAALHPLDGARDATDLGYEAREDEGEPDARERRHRPAADADLRPGFHGLPRPGSPPV
jgi:hypothetical protein